MKDWLARQWPWIAVAVLSPVIVAVTLMAVQRSGGSLESARQHLEGHEPASAVLELKGLLQVRPHGPDAAEARLLLGRAHLALNDAAAAEAEFNRALQAGLPVSRVAGSLAEALRAQGRSTEVLTRFQDLQPSDPQDAAALLTQRAWAHADAGKRDAARAALQQALGVMPDFMPARLLQARLQAGAGDRRGAMQTVDAILAANPGHPPAWTLKAELHRVEPDGLPAATAAYRKALSLSQRQLTAHEGLVTVLIRTGNLSAARSAWQAMARAFPVNGLTAYLDAFLALKEDDAQRARTALQPLLQVASPSAPLLVLAGQAEYRLGAWVQAQTYFAKAVAVASADAVPRQHLAMVMLRRGQAAGALEALRPVLGGAAGTPQAWALAGHAYLMQGDARQSAAAFERAAQLAPNDLALRTSKAQAALSQGHQAQGLGELAAISAIDSGITADLALIAEQLNRRDFDAALGSIDVLSRKEPQSPLAENLRGQLALLRQDRTAARAHFEQALATSAGDPTALQHLSGLDVADGKPGLALARFEAVLGKDPAHVGALLGLAELGRIMRTDPRALLPRLEQAVRASPADARLRLAQVDQLVRAQDLPAALAAAQAAASVEPADPAMLERWAGLLQRNGDRNQALVVWRRLAASQPLPPAQNLRIAQAMQALDAANEADELLQVAMAADPDSLAAQRLVITKALQQRAFANAQALARALQKRKPTEALGYELEGDSLAAQGLWEKAAQAYSGALTKRNVSTAPAGLHQALLQTKGRQEAERFQQEWLRQHPGDVRYQLFLSQLAAANGDSTVAIERLRGVIELAPDLAVAHNNLAHHLWKSRQGGALASADRAVTLAPQVPAFLDTLAMILGDEGRLEDALKVQRRALDLAPDSGAIRLNLVRLQLKAGDQAGAREESTRLRALGDRFARQAEVAQLFAGLDLAPQAPADESDRVGSSANLGTAPSVGLAPLLWAAASGLLALPLLTVAAVAASRPGRREVDAAALLAAPAERSFDTLSDLRNWSSWSPLPAFRDPPAMQFVGAPGAPASACEWRSSTRGPLGRVEVVQSSRPNELVVDVTMGTDPGYREVWRFELTEPAAGTTQVHVTLQGHESFWTRVLRLLTFGKARQRRRLASSLARFREGVEGDERAGIETVVKESVQAAPAAGSGG